MIIKSSKQLQPRYEHDFYKTPPDFCASAVATISADMEIDRPVILDPGAGLGVWGSACRSIWPESIITGVEIQDMEHPNIDYNFWYNEDFLTWKSDISYDLIIGNPPYKFSKEFIEKSYDLLNPGGRMAFLLRLSFLESKKRYVDFYTGELRPSYVYVSVRRFSFTNNKKSDDTAYALYEWDKGYDGETVLDWIDWNYND